MVGKECLWYDKNIDMLKTWVWFASSFLHLAISFIVIVIAAYLIGFTLIMDPLAGNDALNSLTFISFLDKHFPNVPLWFPYQGAGMSITLGYPQLYSYMVIVLSRLTNLSVVSAMGIVNFASVLVFALGVWLFVVTRLKSKTGGVIAGIFSLFSPMLYYWTVTQGFLAQTFSVAFIPWYFLCFDWLAASVFSNKSKSVAFVATCGIGLLILLAHPTTMMGVFAASAFYIIGLVFSLQNASFVQNLLKGAFLLTTVAIVILGLAFWWLLPFQAYLSYANRGIAQTIDPSVWPGFTTQGILNLVSQSKEYAQYDGAAITPSLWLLAIVGTFIGFSRNKKVAFMGILAFFSLIFIGSFTVWTMLAHVSYFVAGFFSIRTFYPIALFLFPIVSAMGVVYSVSFVIRPRNLASSFVHVLAVCVFAAFATLLLLRVSAFYNNNQPSILPIGPSASIDILAIWNRTFLRNDNGLVINRFCSQTATKPPDICTLSHYQSFFDVNTLAYVCSISNLKYKKSPFCKGDLQNTQEIALFIASQCTKQGWVNVYPYDSPCLALGKSVFSQLTTIPWPIMFDRQVDTLSLVQQRFGSGFALQIPSRLLETFTGENHRIDIVPSASGALVKSWYLRAKSSLLNSYTGQTSIIKIFYNDFLQAVEEGNVPMPSLLSSLASYFGTEAIALNLQKAPLDGFAKAGWTRDGALVFPPFKTGLVTIGNLPKVLIVGSKERQAYHLVFRNIVQGGLPFEKGILVDGKETIGDESADELSTYALIILQGYKYKERNADLALLRSYIEHGGSVFIDTGWQYVSADWGLEKRGETFASELPEPFPVSQTSWGGLGKSWDHAWLDQDFAENVLLSNFAQLVWEDFEWGVASSDRLRNWAKPIVSKNGKIIIAKGELGKGKIVWSGMNLLAHALEVPTQNYDEMRFIANIFSYLLDKKNASFIDDFTLSRPYPDELTIHLKTSLPQGSTVYFRENFYPSWKAFALKGGEKVPLAISVAGPNFMAVSVPALAQNDSVVFSFLPPKEMFIGAVVSLATLVLLLFFLFGGSFNGLFSKIKGLFGNLLKSLGDAVAKHYSTVKQEFNKEEDY